MFSIIKKLLFITLWIFNKLFSFIDYEIRNYSKIEIVKRNYSSGKIFKNLQLVEKKGYYALNKTFSEEELNEYYSQNYSKNTSNNKNIITLRDLNHFIIIDYYLNNFFKSKKVFVNYGSANGGISHLMYLLGHKVVNVELGNRKYLNYNSPNYKYLDYLEEIEDDSVDFLYSSHSLEHVRELNRFEKIVRKKLKTNSFIFVEVPNAEGVGNGPLENKIKIPHTYYFKKEYFNTNFKNILLNETFKKVKTNKDVSNWKDNIEQNNSGNVIIFLGQL